MRILVLTVIAAALLSGCAGTRAPKLAKCVGPSRYANPYGTVLPTLPIAGHPEQTPAASPQPRVPAVGAGQIGGSSPASPPAAPDAPPKTSAIPPFYRSC
jgi:hypothetical protein